MAFHYSIQFVRKGYGDMSPKTEGGRIFLMFYALFGLGLTAFVLGKVAEAV